MSRMVHYKKTGACKLVGAMRLPAGLLDLDTCYRVNSFDDEDTHHIVKVSKARTPQPCPECNGRTIIHSNKTVTVYHEPLKNKPCLIHLAKRRLICKRCSKTFDEAQPLLSGITPHLSHAGATYIAECFKEGKSAAQIQHTSGAPKDIVSKVQDCMDIGKHRLPHNLCIDETRVFPKRIAVKQNRPHMSACIYDAEHSTLVDMLKGDGGSVVRAWLSTFTKGELDQVQTVSCDLNGSYIKLARECFPNASIYADKFHVSKLVTEAVDDIRKRITKERDPDDTKVLTKISKLITTRHANLDHRKIVKVASGFEADYTSDLRVAYYVLQLFFEWSDKNHETRQDMETSLKHWISRAKSTKVAELNRVANTINRNIVYVLNAWEHGRTNAIAEAMNRRIKDIIRDARGFNSFKALRRRCLIVLGHDRKPKGSIPLFKRSKSKEVKAN